MYEALESKQSQIVHDNIFWAYRREDHMTLSFKEAVRPRFWRMGSERRANLLCNLLHLYLNSETKHNDIPWNASEKIKNLGPMLQSSMEAQKYVANSFEWWQSCVLMRWRKCHCPQFLPIHWIHQQLQNIHKTEHKKFWLRKCPNTIQLFLPTHFDSSF